MPYSTRIIDRGRGPEIEVTRITVYDILDYHTHGRHHAFVASLLGLSSEQVLAAVRYIDEHRDEVMPVYERIVARSKQAEEGQEERVAAARARLLARKRELEAAKRQRETT